METEIFIAQKLLQIKAIKLSLQNPFTWASGMRSPIYCDNRITLSHPVVRNEIKKSLGHFSAQFSDFDMVAGVATAGIAHGALLADYLNLPFSYVRSSPKGHGRQNQIEGEILDNSMILVIEDLISTGGSSLEVVNILRNEGHNVVGVLAIFDYGFDIAKQKFLNADCKYLSLSNYNVLIQEAKKLAYITSEEESILSLWNKNPEGWFSDYQQNLTN